jgi:hypothetical protein
LLGETPLLSDLSLDLVLLAHLPSRRRHLHPCHLFGPCQPPVELQRSQRAGEAATDRSTGSSCTGAFWLTFLLALAVFALPSAAMAADCMPPWTRQLVVPPAVLVSLANTRDD